jgi:hypothetical protein
LAVVNGRSPQHVIESDLAQARRELTSEETLPPDPSPAERVPEENRWLETPESTGAKAETVAAADEQMVAERLVQEGVEDAEHDQMVRASRAAWKRDLSS